MPEKTKELEAMLNAWLSETGAAVRETSEPKKTSPTRLYFEAIIIIHADHYSNTLAHCICSNSSGQAGSPVHPLRAIEYGAHEPKCWFHT